MSGRKTSDGRRADYERPAPWEVCAIASDERYAEVLAGVVRRCGDEIEEARRRRTREARERVRGAVLDAMVAKAMGEEPPAETPSTILAERDELARGDAEAAKADAYRAIDLEARNRASMAEGARSTSGKGAVRMEGWADALFKRPIGEVLASRTVEDFRGLWNARNSCSGGFRYDLARKLRRAARERGMDFNPRHMADDTAELSYRVAEIAKRYVKALPDVDVSEASRRIAEASCTGKGADGLTLVAYSEADGMPLLSESEYRDGEPEGAEDGR